MFQKYKYHFLLHFIIFLWGFTGILGKLIHLDFLHIVWNRLLIALIGLGICLVIIKRPIKISSFIQLWQLCGVGIIIALHWVTFFKKIQLSTASLGILCLSTITIHVAWLEPLVMKRKFSWLEFALGICVIFGIAIVASDFNPNDFEALAYGLVSALLAASFSVFNGHLVKTIPSSTMTFYEILAGLLFLSVVLWFQGEFNATLFDMTLSDFSWLLFLGLVCTSFAFLATIEIVKRLGAFTVSLCINLEPVYTIILAIVILNENKKLGTTFYIGACSIILVLIANPIARHYFKPKILANP